MKTKEKRGREDKKKAMQAVYIGIHVNARAQERCHMVTDLHHHALVSMLFPIACVKPQTESEALTLHPEVF